MLLLSLLLESRFFFFGVDPIYEVRFIMITTQKDLLYVFFDINQCSILSFDFASISIYHVK